MLDPNLLASSPDLVRESLRRRHAPPDTFAAAERLVELIAARRAFSTEVDRCRAVRNELSPKIGAAMKAGKKEEAESMKAEVKAASDRTAELEKELRRLEEEESALILGLPNIVAHDTPDGRSDKDNPVVRQVGEV
ncbi:MAG TPA: hypothetical protein PKY30_06040, partial [Myxococcota bacterium]|nr:hypothetical protein [Myxococcota bacterium]